MKNKKLFGRLADGREVYSYTLRNNDGMKVKIMTYGATLMQIKVPDRYGCFTDVIGGYDSLASYVGATGFQGAVVGRCANRVSSGGFTLDGVRYELSKNRGETHIHGGFEGFDSKIWSVIDCDDDSTLILEYVSEDMEEGYPGRLTTRITYKLLEDNAISINFFAITDKKTVVNLLNHSFFNLAGYANGSILDHELTINSDRYLEIGDHVMPTGKILSVEGTPFDFREPKKISKDFYSDEIKLTRGYDHCFAFDDNNKEIVKRAELYDEKSGRVLELYTNQPAMQLYTANYVNEAEYPFKGGYPQRPHSFVCLEAERMPDSVNHKNFTNAVLDVGESYDYTTIYKFGVK